MDGLVQRRVEEKLSTGLYDFVEFGCGDGSSMEFAKKYLDAQRGLGIDLSPWKIELAQRAGCDVELGDATKLHGVPNAVRFVQMKHFLEHLDGRERARGCIESACVVARDFLYIKGPWFDADSYLFRNELKLYWSDWDGHDYHLSALDLQRILTPIEKVRRFAIFGLKPIKTSGSQAVLPLSAPRNCNGYDPDLHSAKRLLTFQNPVYREIGCLVQLAADWDLDAWASRLQWNQRLYDSNGSWEREPAPSRWRQKLNKLLRSPARFARDIRF